LKFATAMVAITAIEAESSLRANAESRQLMVSTRNRRPLIDHDRSVSFLTHFLCYPIKGNDGWGEPEWPAPEPEPEPEPSGKSGKGSKGSKSGCGSGKSGKSGCPEPEPEPEWPAPEWGAWGPPKWPEPEPEPEPSGKSGKSRRI
jgi:hypothetical protein